MISIIIPVYNVESFLGRCLESLIAQTYSSLEFIFVDDGSSDTSMEILRQYEERDVRIKVLSQSNAGPATARNQGLALASGEYVMFCDADDWYEPTMCEEMLHAIEGYKVDCVMCGVQVEDELEDLNRGDEDVTYYQVPGVGFAHVDDAWRMKINVCVFNKIFRRSLIDQYGIAFPDALYNHEDDAFMFKYLGVSGNIFFLDKALYHYSRREDSLQGLQMSGRNQGETVRIDVVRFCYAWLLAQGLWIQLKCYFLEIYRLEFAQCYKNLYDEQLPLLIEEEAIFSESLSIDFRALQNRQARSFFQCLLHQNKILLEGIVYGVRGNKVWTYKLLSLLSVGEVSSQYKAKYLCEVGKRRKSMPRPINRD